MNNSSLVIRNMRIVDVEAGMRLKAAAHWNQLPNDWLGLMNLDPNGCFVGQIESVIVGSATGLRYDNNLGWIGMVLVDPVYRRQGIATNLMNHAIEYLESSSCRCMKLDATDAGAKVYEKMGFTYEYQVERWRRLGNIEETSFSSGIDLRSITPEDMEVLGKWDESLFGANRTRLLQWYLTLGFPAYWVGDLKSPKGFVMGRPGSNAVQIGPLSARNSEVAEVLFVNYLTNIPDGPVFVDIVAPNHDIVTILRAHGFEKFRVLQRMYRGENHQPGHPENIFCMAGFEFG